MVRALAQADERDVRLLARGNDADLGHVDLGRNNLMAQT